MRTKTSYNQTFKDQNNTLVRSTFKKAIVNAVNITSQTVDIQIVGNPSTIIKDVPVSSAIDLSSVQPGNRCRVDVFDETNPNDMVVAYFYGGTQTFQRKVLFSSGYFTGGVSGTDLIPHTLGVKPDIYGVFESLATNFSGRVTPFPVSADSTNLTITATVGIFNNYYWFAIKF